MVTHKGDEKLNINIRRPTMSVNKNVEPKMERIHLGFFKIEHAFYQELVLPVYVGKVHRFFFHGIKVQLSLICVSYDADQDFIRALYFTSVIILE